MGWGDLSLETISEAVALGQVTQLVRPELRQ